MKSSRNAEMVRRAASVQLRSRSAGVDRKFYLSSPLSQDGAEFAALASPSVCMHVTNGDFVELHDAAAIEP